MSSSEISTVSFQKDSIFTQKKPKTIFWTQNYMMLPAFIDKTSNYQEKLFLHEFLQDTSCCMLTNPFKKLEQGSLQNQQANQE